MVASKLYVLMEEYVKIIRMDLVNVFVPRDFSGNFVKTVSPFSLSHLKGYHKHFFFDAYSTQTIWLLKYCNFLQGDPCNTQPSPCQHGGTCSFDEDLNVSCECTPEYEGDHCQLSKTYPIYICALYALHCGQVKLFIMRNHMYQNILHQIRTKLWSTLSKRWSMCRGQEQSRGFDMLLPFWLFGGGLRV